MTNVLLIIWYIFYIIQSFMAYGTAYRFTKTGGDNGIALFGWMVAFGLAACVPGLGIYLWMSNKDKDIDWHPSDNRFAQYLNIKKCSYCFKEIRGEGNYCSYCGNKINEEKPIKEESDNEDDLRKKYKSLEDLIQDEKIIEGAKLMRRMYGDDAYYSYLKNKALELGLEDVEINDLEKLQ